MISSPFYSLLILTTNTTCRMRVPLVPLTTDGCVRSLKNPCSWVEYTDIECSFSTGIRRFAFEKLAALAVKTPVNGEESDIVRLSQLYQYPTKHHNEFLDNGTKGLAPKSQVPMV